MARSTKQRKRKRKSSAVLAPPVWRHYALLVGCVGLGCVVAAKVVSLGVGDREFLQLAGDARSIRTEAMPAHRGVIYDRHGEPLAVSTPVVSIWFDPSVGELDETQRQALAVALRMPPERLRAILERNRGRSFCWLKRRLKPATAERVALLDVPGVGFRREYQRYYPAGETTSHLLGITNIDDQGIEGVELAFEDALRGEPGEKKVLRDRLGNNVKDLEFVRAPRLGRDIYLSIDLRLQYFAYRELKAAVVSHQAKSGSLVMLNPRTGEVLAMVNQPAYNPNRREADFSEMRNRAITDIYEPGSTVKPLTLIAALESGEYDPETTIDTSPGELQVGRKVIEDPFDRGEISLTRVLQKSSQVGIAKVALDLPDASVFELFTRAGFGSYTGLGLPGEAAGRLSEARTRDPISRATLAYGYGFALTPLQLAASYQTLANGGQAHDISILRRTAPPSGRQAFDEEAALAVREMLAGVVSVEGTAPLAAVHGFKVGGKTGTARKVGESGYEDSRHVAWFAGIAPLDEPEIVMVVAINEPSRGPVGGGDVAAPVFSRVAARALRTLAVTPETQSTAVAAGAR